MPYEVGLEAVERLRPLVPAGVPMARFALRRVLDQAVTVVIPGARDAGQARDNAAAAALDPLPGDVRDAVRTVYTELVAPHVHDLW